MEERETDLKKLFLFMFFVGLFIILYELYVVFSFKKIKEKKKGEVKSLRVKVLPVKVDKEVSFDLKFYKIKISLRGGVITSLYDKRYKFDLISEEERKLGILPLQVYTLKEEKDKTLASSYYKVFKDSKGRIHLLYEGKNFKVEKVLEERRGGFFVSLKYDNLKGVFLSVGLKPKERSFYTHSGPILIRGGALRLDEEDLKKSLYLKDLKVAGEESRYFFKGFVGNLKEVLVVPLGEERSTLLVHFEGKSFFFAGAKEYKLLKEIKATDLLDWGFFKLLVKPLFIFLYWIYELTKSWVLSITILTLIVRIVTFPLSYKSFVSMKRMQELAPKIEKIRKKYRDDPVKMQEEMMKLYKEAGFNPASGCLPMLLQIPIFFSLYKVLLITVDLKVSSFLWLPSLAQKDPYYVLPVLMGLSMIAQQFFTPSTDKKQALTGYLMAVGFTILFANFPSGLVIYWTISNLIGIAQNYLMKRMMEGKNG